MRFEHLGCSRPLCSSQATDEPTSPRHAYPHPPDPQPRDESTAPTPEPPGPTMPAVRTRPVTRSPRNPPPSTHPPKMGRAPEPVVSGPNSVLYEPPPPTRPTFQPPTPEGTSTRRHQHPKAPQGGVLAGHHEGSGPTVNVPPMSNHQTHDRRLRWPALTPTRTHRATPNGATTRHEHHPHGAARGVSCSLERR
jgi:hypothetical protein